MASKKKHIQIYDTTLRDGAQSENITFTVGDKLRICTQLDQAGFDYIEAGWPGASPKDTDFFDRAKKELKLKLFLMKILENILKNRKWQRGILM